MAATRSKYEMSHFQIYERSFDIRPHVMTAYDTDYRLAHSPVPLGEKQEYAASFEIGPWRRDRHDEIIHAAQLDRPHRVSDPPPSGSGRARGELPGVVFKAIDFADAAAHSEDYAPDKWMAAGLPFCRSERVLVSQPGVVPPPLTLDPGLKGVCRVNVGVGNGAGVVVKLSGDDMPMFRLADITIWVRPNHCLFDGIDLPTWLDEGLCDEVVADVIVAPLFKNRECYDVRPEWKEMVQRQVPLIRGIPGFDFDMAKRMVPEILEQRYDGICTYESDYTVVHDGYRELYWSLRM